MITENKYTFVAAIFASILFYLDLVWQFIIINMDRYIQYNYHDVFKLLIIFLGLFFSWKSTKSFYSIKKVAFIYFVLLIPSIISFINTVSDESNLLHFIYTTSELILIIPIFFCEVRGYFVERRFNNIIV